MTCKQLYIVHINSLKVYLEQCAVQSETQLYYLTRMKWWQMAG